MVPTFTSKPIDERGVQLYPCGIATATPQTFTVASRPVDISRPEFPATAQRSRYAPQPSPYPPDLSWWAVKERQRWFLSYTFSSR